MSHHYNQQGFTGHTRDDFSKVCKEGSMENIKAFIDNHHKDHKVLMNVVCTLKNPQDLEIFTYLAGVLLNDYTLRAICNWNVFLKSACDNRNIHIVEYILNNCGNYFIDEVGYDPDEPEDDDVYVGNTLLYERTDLVLQDLRFWENQNNDYASSDAQLNYSSSKQIALLLLEKLFQLIYHDFTLDYLVVPLSEETVLDLYDKNLPIDVKAKFGKYYPIVEDYLEEKKEKLELHLIPVLSDIINNY
jgi:hypothetical protein